MEEVIEIEVEIVNKGKPDTGYLPLKANLTDAGMDVYATEDVFFHQGQVTKHPLNIKFKLPKGTYAHIKGKSGLGCQGLCLLAEIIDEGYRGIPHIVATNLTAKSIRIKKNAKIAQIIVHPYGLKYVLKEVDKINEDTSRGAGKFGSSGEF